MHRVIEDVRTAYWRAISGERLLVKLRELEGRVKRAQASAKSIAAERSTSPITAVTYERELVEIGERSRSSRGIWSSPSLNLRLS